MLSLGSPPLKEYLQSGSDQPTRRCSRPSAAAPSACHSRITAAASMMVHSASNNRCTRTLANLCVCAVLPPPSQRSQPSPTTEFKLHQTAGGPGTLRSATHLSMVHNSTYESASSLGWVQPTSPQAQHAACSFEGASLMAIMHSVCYNNSTPCEATHLTNLTHTSATCCVSFTMCCGAACCCSMYAVGAAYSTRWCYAIHTTPLLCTVRSLCTPPSRCSVCATIAPSSLSPCCRASSHPHASAKR